MILFPVSSVGIKSHRFASDNVSLLCLLESRYCFVRLLSSGRLNCEEWNEGYLPDEYTF